MGCCTCLCTKAVRRRGLVPKTRVNFTCRALGVILLYSSLSTVRRLLAANAISSDSESETETLKARAGFLFSKVLKERREYRHQVLFVVSGSVEDVARSLTSISSYSVLEAHLLFNFHDGTPARENTTQVFFSAHRGLKPVFWSNIDSSLLLNYEYVWLLDSDMVFDKRIFAFSQFIFLVRQLNATIATPSIFGAQQDNWLSGFPESKTHFAVRATRVEQGKPLMKSELLQFFLKQNIFNPAVHEFSDWGPDFFWCALAETLQLGDVDCVIVPFLHMLHLDTKTISKNIHKQWNSTCAENWYLQQAKKFGVEARFNEPQNITQLDDDVVHGAVFAEYASSNRKGTHN